jgi:integrase/recombinase XerD
MAEVGLGGGSPASLGSIERPLDGNYMTRPKPATLASMLHSFFVEYLPRQRALSPHTLCSYRDSIKLLLQFFAERNGGITKLTVEDLTVAHVTAFLQHLETARHNCTGTRNVRLSYS